MADRRVQFNNYIPEDDKIEFQKTIARKYGIYHKNMQSYELGQLIRWYNSVGGILPDTAHTHKKQHLETNILVSKPKIEVISAIVPAGGRREEYHNLPLQDDPILTRWLLTKGIDLASPHSIASHLTEEDIKVGQMSEAELMQWKNGIHNNLIAIRRQRDNKKWRSTVGEKDRMLEPELRTIKQHLNNTDSIKEENKVHVDQIYKAWTSATHKRDKQRVFKNRLEEYLDGGYFTPLDDKHKILRAENKFLAL